MSELGPLHAPMTETDFFWIVILLFAVPAIAVSLLVLVRGKPSVLASSAAILLVPAVGYLLGNIHMLDESKRVDFCGSCHTSMPPVVESMKMDGNDLAATHYREDAVSRRDACYQCHSGDGLAGDFQAAVDGIRHMIHTIANTKHYPLEMHGVFDIAACLDCHAETPAFQVVKGHRTLGIRNQMDAGKIGCTGTCHAPAHPPAALNGTRAWERWKEAQR